MKGGAYWVVRGDSPGAVVNSWPMWIAVKSPSLREFFSYTGVISLDLYCKCFSYVQNLVFSKYHSLSNRSRPYKDVSMYRLLYEAAAGLAEST
jgi:hypothetical protein